MLGFLASLHASWVGGTKTQGKDASEENVNVIFGFGCTAPQVKAKTKAGQDRVKTETRLVQVKTTVSKSMH